MAAQIDIPTESRDQTPTSTAPPPSRSLPPVDAFILFNEEEDSVPAVVTELQNRGVTTHFWRRDIKYGEPLELEQSRLDTARVVVVFLGERGWGPTHRQLALQASTLGKRRIPVLIGSPPPDALDDAGGIFRQLRYVDLRERTYAAVDELSRAILGNEEDRSVDRAIEQLVNGSDSDRDDVLGRIARGRIADRQLLSRRLREEINRYSADQSFALAPRDPRKIPSIRSWMLSALGLADVEDADNRQLLLRHVSTSEPEHSVRFWCLAGLYWRGASYLAEAQKIAGGDLAPDISLLALAIGSDDSPLESDFRSRLLDADFENRTWPALRALRVRPLPAVAPDVCKLLEKPTQGGPLAYDALNALTSPAMAAAAAPLLKQTRGIDGTVDLVLDVLRDADLVVARDFATVLAALGVPEVERSLNAAAGRRPDDAHRIIELRIRLRDHRRDQTGPQSYVAGYAAETIDVTQDALDIREDVQTLTAVMLSKDVDPPLAIGLFGDWGSGKSFFMQSIKATAQRIAGEARGNPGSKFCANVVPIEFNAWHYADTSLWASLASHILETLARHVTPEETLEKKQEKLVAERKQTSEQVQDIEEKAKERDKTIGEKESELQKLQLERQQKELELRDLQLSDLQTLLSKDPELKESIKKAFEDMGLPVALSSVGDLTQAMAEVNSLRGRFTTLTAGLFKGGNWRLALALVILMLLLPFLATWFYDGLSGTLKLVGTIVAEIASLIGGAAVLLHKTAQYVAGPLQKLETAKAEVDRMLAEKRSVLTPKEVELQKEIAALKIEKDSASGALRDATTKLRDIESRIALLLESGSLARFLSERSTSEDYRKHLGLISTIQRDFKLLTERLVPARQPAGGTPVDRIVLYIDDLDRCPADKVVDVLQAVHLLLAYKLFVVVVAVDPRWLSHALRARFSALGGAAIVAPDPDMATPQNYLEKIFQIPFSLRPMTDTGYEALVKRLLAAADTPRVTATPPTQGVAPAPKPPVAPGGISQPAAINAGAAPAPPPPAPPPPPGGGGPPPRLQPANPSTPPPLAIHDDALIIRTVEGDFAATLFRLLPTPRATKRFTNIYRMLKAPIPPHELAAFEGSNGARGTFQVPMLLLAILIGLPAHAPRVFTVLWNRVLNESDPLSDRTLGLGEEAPVELRAEVSRIVAAPDFPREREILHFWLPRVARFSFEVGRLIKPREMTNAQQ